MAGDWLKVEKDTPDKPETLALARALSMHPDEAFGKCFRFWRWADSHLRDGNACGVTENEIDALVGRSGFAVALIKVGWLQVRNGSLVVPNFDRHMSQSAKSRALTAKRVSRHKERSGNDSVTVGALPEKRREEKRIIGGKPPITPCKLFERFWNAFPAGRKANKGRSRAAFAKACSRIDAETIIAAAIEYAASPVGRGQFVRGPEPWLNGECWDDDRTAWQRSDKQETQNGKSRHGPGQVYDPASGGKPIEF